MTIEINRVTNPTHQENLACDLACYTCEEISEEDGTPLGFPNTLISWIQGVSFSTALEMAQKHESERGVNHQLKLTEIDFQKIRGALWEEK